MQPQWADLIGRHNVAGSSYLTTGLDNWWPSFVGTRLSPSFVVFPLLMRDTVRSVPPDKMRRLRVSHLSALNEPLRAFQETRLLAHNVWVLMVLNTYRNLFDYGLWQSA